MRLRSAIPGRQRWDVPAIHRRRDRAGRLQAWLASRPGVLEARADAVTGRVLVRYDTAASEQTQGAAVDIEALILEGLAAPETTAAPAAGGESPLRRMLQLAAPEPRALAGPAALSVIGQGVHIAQGLAFMSTLNAARRSVAARGLVGAAGGVAIGPRLAASLALTGLDLFITYRRKQAWRRAAADARQRLRTAVLEKVEAQDAAFFDRYGAQRLASIVTNDTQQIADLIEHAGDQAISKAVTVAVAGVAVTAASPKLALVGALPLPLLFLPGRLVHKAVRQRYAAAADDSDRFAKRLADNFAGIADIKGYTAESAELRRLAEADARQAASSVDAASVSSLQALSVEGIFSGGYALTAAYAGRLATGGGLGSDALAKFLYFYPQIASAVMTIGELTRRVHMSAQAAERLVEIMDAPPAIQDGQTRAPLAAVKGEIVFEDVTFRYGEGRGGLEQVSFTARPGETVAIVGPTGAGKSTLVRLLPRHYDVDAGRILLDGRDIRELRLADLRRAIGVVRQDAYLFDGTVADNVRLARPGVGDARVETALRSAQVMDLVASLPGGLDADVGEGGRRLSGGERQRIAVARAFLKHAPILVLDEVTSHLDYATEAELKRAIRRNTRGRTVIVVAHRLSTIRDADRIIVLDRGRVREQGGHDELVAQDGLYASLWRLQSEEERAFNGAGAAADAEAASAP